MMKNRRKKKKEKEKEEKEMKGESREMILFSSNVLLLPEDPSKWQCSSTAYVIVEYTCRVLLCWYGGFPFFTLETGIDIATSLNQYMNI